MEEAELFAEIERSPTVDLLQRLVRTPSHPGVPQQESRVVQELSAFLEAAGLEVELSEVRDGRPNLVCSIAGRRQGRHLLLCGHTDTVPLNVGEPGYGFSGEIAEGRVRGRGAVDMKGALAAMAAALVAVQLAPAGT
jgi:acetylornithine deacetylase/succinyl-diaminopimelate desuccinylase-like protein